MTRPQAVPRARMNRHVDRYLLVGDTRRGLDPAGRLLVVAAWLVVGLIALVTVAALTTGAIWLVYLLGRMVSH